MPAKQRPTVAERFKDLTPQGAIEKLEEELRLTRIALNRERDAGLVNFANYRNHCDALVKERDQARAEVEEAAEIIRRLTISDRPLTQAEYEKGAELASEMDLPNPTVGTSG